MKRSLVLIVLSLAIVVAGQDIKESMGEIEFYGYAGLSPDKIRAALPIQEGDNFNAAPDAMQDLSRRVKETVNQAIGLSPTDVATVCCNAQGNWMLYIGLPNNSTRRVPYNPPPKGALAT